MVNSACRALRGSEMKYAGMEEAGADSSHALVVVVVGAATARHSAKMTAVAVAVGADALARGRIRAAIGERIYVEPAE